MGQHIGPAAAREGLGQAAGHKRRHPGRVQGQKGLQGVPAEGPVHGLIAQDALQNRDHGGPCDFPRVHPARLGRPHRYTYAARLAPTDDATPRLDGVIKFDHHTRQGIERGWGPGRVGGEVVFAPRPGAESEDDGWLMTFVFDEAKGSSELVVLSAQDLSPVARVILPVRVPYGFHGDWVPAV